MKDKKIWGYAFSLGIAVTAIGILSPWWCSGHHSFECTNSLGFTWYTTWNFRLLQPAGFTPSIGILMLILLAGMVWLEMKQPETANKVRNALVSLMFLVCLIAVVSTLQLVREANCGESFTAWTTKYINSIFPMNDTCNSGVTWITDVHQGIWITLAGVLILSIMSFIKSTLRSARDEGLEWA